jgi:hypothetical protein
MEFMYQGHYCTHVRRTFPKATIGGQLQPDHGPYSFKFSVNSKNFIANASVTVPVAV